jgi:hypothetical protein
MDTDLTIRNLPIFPSNSAVTHFKIENRDETAEKRREFQARNERYEYNK